MTGRPAGSGAVRATAGAVTGRAVVGSATAGAVTGSATARAVVDGATAGAVTGSATARAVVGRATARAADHEPANRVSAGFGAENAGPAALVFVGAGPRTTSLLERLAANAPELLDDRPLDVHIIDPYPPGGGRIWRRAQSPLLWMNSVAADVAMFTDSSVQCEGPIQPGPTLAEWVVGSGRPVLEAAGLGNRVEQFSSTDFASRELQSHYLSWVFDEAVAALPPTVHVHVHRRRAVGVSDIPGPVDGAAQRVLLDDGTQLDADLVVLAQGYLDRLPTCSESDISSRAADLGLNYIGPGYTADLDLSSIAPGESVIIRGFGLAFIDLMVLLGQERGGNFDRDADGTLTYRPSGREPVIHVGSRRGVPYHAKLGYVNLGGPPSRPRYFTVAALEQLYATHGRLDYDRDLWPLLVKELTHAHYQRLFTAHADRTGIDWDTFAAHLDASDVRAPAFHEWVAEFVPKPHDRFDIARIDRPLAGETFDGPAALTERLRGYISDDLRRRRDDYFSADLAVFNALLAVYGVIGQAVSAGRIGAADRIQRIEGDLHGFFSFMASGPPPQRLAELLALNAAGVVHFAGPDLQVELADGAFVARSPSVVGSITATTFIEGRLPKPDVLTAVDPVIRSLLAAGELAVETAADAPAPSDTGSQDEGFALTGGHLLADAASRAKRADGSFHPRRFLLGPSVAGSLGSAGFSRPQYNSPFLRQNDAVSRRILRLLSQPTTAPTTALVSTAPTTALVSTELTTAPDQSPSAAGPTDSRNENRDAR